MTQDLGTLIVLRVLILWFKYHVLHTVHVTQTSPSSLWEDLNGHVTTRFRSSKLKLIEVSILLEQWKAHCDCRSNHRNT